MTRGTNFLKKSVNVLHGNLWEEQASTLWSYVTEYWKSIIFKGYCSRCKKVEKFTLYSTNNLNGG